MTQPTDGALLTIIELADKLRMHPVTVRGLWRKKAFPGIRIGYRTVRFEFHAVLDALKATDAARRADEATTADEADVASTIPAKVAVETSLGRSAKAELVRERRAWLKDHLDKNPNPAGGGRWSARKVRELLSSIALHPWNNGETARQDLRAIGYLTPRIK